MVDPLKSLDGLARVLALMATLALLSCTGQVKLSDDDASDDDVSDDDVSDDDASDDDVSDDDVSDDDVSDDDASDDDDTSPFAGNYTGVVELAHSGPDGQYQVSCTGEAVLVVDGNGTLQGDGQCVPDNMPEPLPIAFEGEVSGDGSVSGTATHVTPFGEEPFELTGQFAGGDGFELQWSGEMQTPMGEIIQFQGTVRG